MADKDTASQRRADAIDQTGRSTQADKNHSADPVHTVDPAASASVPGDDASGEARQKEPPSPCVSVCALDENDLCMGCYRTASEITDWFTATPAEKHVILRAAGERRRADSPIRLL